MTATSLAQQILADPIANYPSATVACFDPTVGELPRRKLDEDRTIAFVERLAKAGAPALLIASSTGHGHLRTVEELEQWYRMAASAVIGGCVLTALLRPEDSPTTNQMLAKHLADLGYAVAFVRPGRNLPKSASDEQIAENMQAAVAAIAASGMAVGLYSISEVSGVALSPAAARLLKARPGGNKIVAIKVTEPSYSNSTLKFLIEPQLSGMKIVQGWDPHLPKALLDGPQHDSRQRQRCGVTSGPMSLAIYQYLHILSAAERGDWDEVAESQGAVTALFQAMQDDPAKYADLQRAKVIMGLGQPLTAQVTDEQIERVLTALETWLRPADQSRLARSLDLMGDGPYHDRLTRLVGKE